MDNTEDFYSFNVGSIPAGRTNGGCRQVVKTSDCDSDIRGFESHQLPQITVDSTGVRLGFINLGERSDGLQRKGS